MNRIHRRLCASDGWAVHLRTTLLPAVVDRVDLGPAALEVGPGPGRATDSLRLLTDHLTCIEVDDRLAASLERRVGGAGVTVVHGDATRMPFDDAVFTSAVSMTMLHHVPSADQQDCLLAEVCRVLRPGSVFTGCDSRSNWKFQLIHVGDTMVVVDPRTLPERLRRAGFVDPEVEVCDRRFLFRAHRP